MQASQLEVALEVILEEVDNDEFQSTNVDCSENSINWDYFNKTSFDHMDYDLLKSGIESINQQREKNEGKNIVENIINKGLLIIYNNTTQEERFLYLEDLLKHFYHKLVQRLLKIQKHLLIISEEDFVNLVRIFIPQVKLDVVTHLIRSRDNTDRLKVAVEELYEYMLFPNILREDCYQIIKNKFPGVQIEFIGFQIKPIDTKNGVTSDYFQLNISVKLNEMSRDYYFFLKHFPKSAEHDDIWYKMAKISFDKEETFYTKFISMVRKLGYTEITDFLPNCYLCYKNLFMVFEDLSEQGYTTLDIYQPLTSHQLTIVFRSIAKLHSCSNLFEYKLSQLLGYHVSVNKYFNNMLSERVVTKDSLTYELVKTSIESAVYLFKKIASTSKGVDVEKRALQVNQEYSKVFDTVQPSLKYRNVVTHGDIYCNNILFNHNCTKCYLIDFATVKWCPPSFDTSLLLTVTTNRFSRSKYSSHLLKYYHEQLVILHHTYNLNGDSTIRYQELMESITEIKFPIHVIAVAYLQTKLFPTEMDPTGGDVRLKNYLTDTKSRIEVLERMWNHIKGKYRIEEIIREDMEDILKL